MAISGWRVWIERLQDARMSRSDFSGCRRGVSFASARQPCGRRWPGAWQLKRAELTRAKNRLQRKNHAQNRQHSQHEIQSRCNIVIFHKVIWTLANWRRMSSDFRRRKRIDLAGRCITIHNSTHAVANKKNPLNNGKRHAGAAGTMFRWRCPTGMKCLRTSPADAQKFHPHQRRRQGQRPDVTLRFAQGAHHLPS